MITINKTATGFSTAFPFGLKDDFRATFPSAKWDPKTKTWNVGPRSGKRLEAWAAENEEADKVAVDEGARAYAERQATRAAREAAWAKEREERREAARREYAAERRARDAQMNQVREWRVLCLADRVPAVGSPIMVRGQARIVESLGRPFRADETADEMLAQIGQMGSWGRAVRYVYTKPAPLGVAA